MRILYAHRFGIFQLLKSKPHDYRKKISEFNKNHPKTTWKLINTRFGGSNKLKHTSKVKSENETFHDDENISEAIDKWLINISPLNFTNPSINNIETFLEDHAVTIPSFNFNYLLSRGKCFENIQTLVCIQRYMS